MPVQNGKRPLPGDDGLAAVLEVVDVAIFVCSAAGVLVRWNEPAARWAASCATVGFSPGAHFRAAWPESTWERIDRCHSAALTGQRGQIHLQMRDHNGVGRHFELRWHPTRRDEAITGYVVTLGEVESPNTPRAVASAPPRVRSGVDGDTRAEPARELAESQRRCKSIFEHSIDGLLLMNDSGVYVDANAAALRLLGFAREELAGIDMRQMLFQPDRSDVDAFWEQFLRSGSLHGELSLRRKDFTTVAVEYSAVAHILDGVHLCVLRDVTDRQALQEQLLRQQRLDSVGRLASGLAHDLNNILTPILMVPGMLRGRLQDPASLNLLDLLEQGARRGASIIGQLLTFAREMPGERKLQHLGPLVEAAARLMRETFPRNIELDLRLGGGTWPCLGDATQLQQLLLNLSMNARDAMPNGGRLTISVANEHLAEEEVRGTPGARPGPHVAVSVVDTGKGIDPDFLGRIFDPFFTTKPFGEGTGLGLSTALGIARHHGGFITVRSRVGHGTTFRVFLPAVGAEEPERPAEVAGNGSGQVVLVVDDEEDLRQVARQWLTQHGYRVICAKDGEAALAQLKAADDRVDLVLTDLAMPGMGGERLVALLRRRNPALRIIVMSGRDLETSGSPSASGFLRKPFTGEELLAALK